VLRREQQGAIEIETAGIMFIAARAFSGLGRLIRQRKSEVST
jgi:ATP-dependent protease Clp ATPase subunit